MSLVAEGENAVKTFQNNFSNNSRGTIGVVGTEIPDMSKIDKSVTKQLQQIYIHQDWYEAGEVWLDLLYTLPAFFDWQELISTVGSHAAYEAFVVDHNDFVVAHDIAAYIMADQFTPVVGLPHCIGYLLYNLTVAEKEDFFKSASRSRSQHIDVMRILGVLNAIIVFGTAPLIAIYGTKFYVHTNLVDPISFKAIRYDVYDERTWPAYIYNTWAQTFLNLTEEQVSLMYENVILQFNSYNLIVPIESVKIAQLLRGRFNVQMFKPNGDPDYQVPVDFLFTTNQWDGETARDFHVLGADWIDDLAVFVKIRDILQNIGTVAQTVEYGDSYYGAIFPQWKEQLKYVDLNFDLLKDWTPMLPWPLLHVGAHHHPDPAGYPSAMQWAWNDANHGNDMTIDLGTDVAPDNQSYDMFMRIVPPQLAEGDDALQFFGLKLPGVSDEMYEIALVFMWFWNLPNQGPILGIQRERSTLTDYHNIATFTEYYDSNGTLMFKMLTNVSMDLGGADQWFGWLGTTEHPHFREFYIPKSRLSLAYPNIVKLKNYTLVTGDNEVGNDPNEGTFYEKVMRNVGYYNYSILKFGWKWTWSIFKKIANPIYVKPQKDNPLEKELKPDSDKKMPPPGVIQPPKPSGGESEKKLETMDIPGGKPAETYAKDEGKNGPVNPINGKPEVSATETPPPPDKVLDEDKKEK
jgi:hypothetical protein